MSFISHLRDLLLFLVVLLGPLPSCWSLLRLAESGRERRGFAHSLLTLLTGWCVLETCLGLILGVAHRLTSRAVLTSEIILFLAGVLLCRSVRRRTPPFCWRNLLKWTKSLNHLERLIIGALASVGLTLLWRLATRPMGDFDALWYHLPMMANWYQTASLPMPEQFHGTLHAAFPYNWEVLCSLFLLPFREDFLVAFPNLIAWMLLGLSAYCLSVRLGATRTLSLASASLLLIVPILAEQLNAMSGNLPLAAFFVASVYFAVLYHRTRSVLYFALFLVSLGMMGGIKVSGPIYGLCLLGGLALVEARSLFLQKRGNRSVLVPSPFAVSVGVMGVFCLLLLGGFWYVRNLFETGNPLGCVKVQLAGVTIFPGSEDFTYLRKTTALASVFEPTNLAHWKIVGGQVKERLHVPFLVMGLQAALLPLALVARQKPIQNRQVIGLVVLLLVTGWLYLMTPFTGKEYPSDKDITPWMGNTMRQAFPFMGMLSVAAAVGATAVQTRPEAMTAFVLLGSLVSVPQSLYMGCVLLLSWGWSGAVSTGQRAARRPRLLRMFGWSVALLICAGLIVGATWTARRKRDAARHRVYEGIYEYLARQVGPHEVIGYLKSNKGYLLYGKELNRKVVYAPSDSDDFVQWFDILRQRGISIVAFGPNRETMRWRSVGKMWTDLVNNPAEQKDLREFMWLEAPHGPFVRVFGTDPRREPLLYRFKSQVRKGSSG